MQDIKLRVSQVITIFSFILFIGFLGGDLKDSFFSWFVLPILFLVGSFSTFGLTIARYRQSKIIGLFDKVIVIIIILFNYFEVFSKPDNHW